MKILYYALFVMSVLVLGYHTSMVVNEVVHSIRKSKRTSNSKLKASAVKLVKRMLKVNVALIWIAYETYVKGKRPNTYSMGSWLVNIKIVENKEPIIIAIILGTFLLAFIYATFSKDRVMKAISLDKRAILKKKVKTWDETKLTAEEKEQLYQKLNESGNARLTLA